LISDRLLSDKEFKYREDTACEHHERVGFIPECALGIATHRALKILDVFCTPLGISPTKGHINLQQSRMGDLRNGYGQIG
jgi:hypothetical protein